MPESVFVDSNLLVLLVVGRVNPERIETFKRTNKYRKQDFDLLGSLIGSASKLYSTAHVLAEVSNLTDLKDSEREQARHVLKEVVQQVKEISIPSVDGVNDPVYSRLGLTDAAIVVAAKQYSCQVWTDDFDLYESLGRLGLDVHNFSHYRARSLGF
jgi:predicted nucleic acid-binding protein